MKVRRPEILLISHSLDFSTDHVVYYLQEMGANYLRLNRDQLRNYKISLDPVSKSLSCFYKNFHFKISQPQLKSIYFRAPTFLRESIFKVSGSEDHMARYQWVAFVRALCVFEDVKWINHPVDTYRAEIKPYQLSKAYQIGFNVPATAVTNSKDFCKKNKRHQFALKMIDSSIVNVGNREAFVYTNIVSKDQLLKEETKTFPYITQKALVPKTDIRVTVVGNKVYAVNIVGEKAIKGDWRLMKNKVRYKELQLPQSIETKCRELMKVLNLRYGAIDLVKFNRKYFFLEINPTGEFSWLLKKVTYRIDYELAKLLSRN